MSACPPLGHMAREIAEPPVIVASECRRRLQNAGSVRVERRSSDVVMCAQGLAAEPVPPLARDSPGTGGKSASRSRGGSNPAAAQAAFTDTSLRADVT